MLRDYQFLHSVETLVISSNLKLGALTIAIRAVPRHDIILDDTL